MSRAKSKAREVKKLARIQTGKVLAGVTPEPVAPPAVPSTVSIPQLSPREQALLSELRKFAAELNEFLARAEVGFHCRALAQGMREAQSDSK